jgi:RimJ/RimL family protein N-acetyltransferase
MMDTPALTVRELLESDIDSIVGYWLDADNSHLEAMGVDLGKLPTKEDFTQMLLSQLNLPLEQKRSYCVIWEMDGKPVGHCNTNPSYFGSEAFMHLHIWNVAGRKKGLGAAFLKRSLPYFFENLHLQKLYSEPYALNPAPNKTLEKIGFEFVKEYVTVPGSINFEQTVKRWQMTREMFGQLQAGSL